MASLIVIEKGILVCLRCPHLFQAISLHFFELDSVPSSPFCYSLIMTDRFLLPEMPLPSNFAKISLSLQRSVHEPCKYNCWNPVRSAEFQSLLQTCWVWICTLTISLSDSYAHSSLENTTLVHHYTCIFDAPIPLLKMCLYLSFVTTVIKGRCCVYFIYQSLAQCL